ncbi:MAG: DUF4363 family protein [Oscillibacter sp.]|jgi:hypothetical protein|nr:DUF4363 family protein [Oscillibacter sp.]
MKPLLPPILLLAVLLGFSLVNCSYMVRQTTRWDAELQEADRLAEDERWDEAGQTLSKGYRDWSSHQTYLHIVVKHEEVDGAQTMYLRANAFLQEQELSEFRAELADLRSQLQLLAEMERISIKNIL